MGKIVIGVLRGDVSEEERLAWEEAYPGREVEFTRMDSADYLVHATNCRDLDPAAVFLPKDKPIPTDAMADGYVHVALSPG